MRYPKITILLGLLLFVIAGCKSRVEELPFETVAKSNGPDNLGLTTYRNEEPALLVIAGDEDIKVLIQDVLANDPVLADQLRQLDYDRFFAVLVLQGRKGGTGYAVTVRRIVREEDQVAIEAEFVEPSPGAFIMPAFTSPYHLIAVSKQGEWGQQIRFVLVADSEEVAETSHFIP